MTSVICDAHRELFSRDHLAAEHAFRQLDRLLQQVREHHIEAPILAIHHARIEIAQIQLQRASTQGLMMIQRVLRDLALQQPVISLDAMHYFLDMVRDALADCAFFSQTLRDDAHHLLSSLALLHELPNALLCRALSHIGQPLTYVS